MYFEALDDFVVGTAAFQVGPADEVFAIAIEMAVAVHKTWVNGIALGIDDLSGSVLAHDGFFVADGDKLTVFHGKGLGFGEGIVNGIDVGVVDDEVYGRFLVAGGHKDQN